MKRPTVPKLIVVDGLAGSGKTTTCRWLELQLQQRQLSTRAVYEADVPHPLHWWRYWDGEQHHPPDFDRVAPSAYMESSVERWTQFIADIGQSDDMFIVEGALYCLAVWFFLQADAEPEQIAAYVRRVEAIAAPIAPLLIYLRQDTIAEHSRKVWNSRGAALEQELIMHMERTPYFRRRQLRGFDGVIRLWQDTQTLTDDLFSRHALPKLAIEVTQGDWEAYYRQILNAVVRAE
jgi:hypothetical protein